MTDPHLEKKPGTIGARTKPDDASYTTSSPDVCIGNAQDFRDFLCLLLDEKKVTLFQASHQSKLHFYDWIALKTSGDRHSYQLPSFKKLREIAEYFDLTNDGRVFTYVRNGVEHQESAVEKLIRLHMESYLNRFPQSDGLRCWNKDVLPQCFSKQLLAEANTVDIYLRGALLLHDMRMSGVQPIMQLHHTSFTAATRLRWMEEWLKGLPWENTGITFDQDHFDSLKQCFDEQPSEIWRQEMATILPSPQTIKEAVTELLEGHSRKAYRPLATADNGRQPNESEKIKLPVAEPNYQIITDRFAEEDAPAINGHVSHGANGSANGHSHVDRVARSARNAQEIARVGVGGLGHTTRQLVRKAVNEQNK